MGSSKTLRYTVRLSKPNYQYFATYVYGKISARAAKLRNHARPLSVGEAEKEEHETFFCFAHPSSKSSKTVSGQWLQQHVYAQKMKTKTCVHSVDSDYLVTIHIWHKHMNMLVQRFHNVCTPNYNMYQYVENALTPKHVPTNFIFHHDFRSGAWRTVRQGRS